MKNDERISILGRIGEKIVINHLNNLGRHVQESLDHYDSEKDLLVDGKKVEVKTEQPFVLKNAFTFRENQIRKCRSVDELYFVSIPPVISPKYKWGGWLFKADPKKFEESERYTTKYGNKMVVIPIDQDAITPIRKLTTEEVKELTKYAQSAYEKK